MGIHGIYKEVGPGERIALSKLAVESFEKFGRPIRLAIDTSIWLFQIQAGKGGTNPALRTFYYRLLRLLSLSIHPLFVFDGPNKPPFKRNKRTGPNIASIPEFLAKQLLKQFGFPFHIAPGEAEAECALFQKEGIVDAVLSEDVDTLMFGSRITLRNWSPEVSKSKIPTHVNMYDASKTKAGPSGLDREGMVLVALMSGGDYIPEGIPGCGPKLACEAARAGFGHELCAISRSDKLGIRVWRERLTHELRTNESKYFKSKHKALVIPEEFPSPEVLGYYTRPAVSSPEKLERLRTSLKWDQDINFAELRTFTADAFDWTKIGGAKKFIHNLAPALLIRELRLRGQSGAVASDNLMKVADEEDRLVKSIHGKRNHPSTDNTTELRIAFKAIELVDIDLSIEEPDDELRAASSDSEAEAIADDADRNASELPGSPAKRRAPSSYDPMQVEKIWISETFVKAGVPLKVQDWEESFRNVKKYNAMKHANIAATKSSKTSKRAARGGMPRGAMNQFSKVTKPGLNPPDVANNSKSASITSSTPSNPLLQLSASQPLQNGISCPPSTALTSSREGHRLRDLLEVVSSTQPPPSRTGSLPQSVDDMEIIELPSTVTKRRRSPLKRSQTDTAVLDLSMDSRMPATPSQLPHRRRRNPSPQQSPSESVPSKKPKPVELRISVSSPLSPSPKRATATPKKQIATIDLLSSSPVQQTNITHYFSPSKQRLRYESAISVQIPDSPSNSTRSRRDAPSEPLQEASASTTNCSNRRSRGSGVLASSYIGRPLDLAEQLDLTDVTTENIVQPSFPMPPPCLKQIPASHSQPNPSKGPPARNLREPPPTRPVAATQAQKRKEVIRVRESLVGAFAIEEVDLTDSPLRHGGRGVRKRFRGSEVSVLDLTGV